MTDTPSPGQKPADEVLAEATNLRAARIREALELARTRGLEAAGLRRERDEAIRQRDAARASLDRFRRRRIVRLAVRTVRAVRAIARGRSGDRVAPRTAPAPARLAAAPGDPVAYRETLLGRLRAASGSADPIRAAVVGRPGAAASTASAALAAAVSSLGWASSVAEPAAASTAKAVSPVDIAIVTSPDHDPRSMPREIITVACVTGSTPDWTGKEWFDGFDIVLVRDAATGRAIAVESFKTATVVVPEPGQWPPAVGLRDAVVAWAAAVRIAVMVQALRWDVAEPSGDYHLARGLQRQFERRGHPTSIYFQREWTRPATAREDIVIHLWGRYELDARSTQVNALWILYHPELVTDELCRRYDRVFAASDELARRISERTGLEVASLHQGTDPERFRPSPGGPIHELLFVGNSRGTRRTIIDDVSPSGHDLAVYGGGWEPELVDPASVRGTVVANRELASYYSGAAIVLNDHWPESVEAGLINNRLYDALSAGAFVISDSVPGLDEEFDGGVVTYTDAADLALKVERFLADPDLRRAHVERGRAAVLARHTLAHRADDLLASLLPLAAGAAPGDR